MNYILADIVVGGILRNPVLGSISLSLTMACLQTLTTTTQEIYGFITTIKNTTYHVNISNLMMELDLESEILVLECLLKEINIEKNHTQTLALCLKLLEDCILDIHKLLNEVHQRIVYNNNLWINFYGTRAYKFDDISDKLRFLKANLDKRKDNLIKIIQINNFLIPCTPILETIIENDDDDLNVSIISIDKTIVTQPVLEEK